MSGILEYLNILVKLPRHQPTYTVKKVPLMFEEPYILSGYRPTNKSWSYYFFSFFQLHNESINVWTHTLAFVIVLLQVGHMFTYIDVYTHKDAATVIGFAIGNLANAFLSAAAHLLHSKSPWWHYVWFLLDYAGVTMGSFGTGLACFYICSQDYLYGVFERFFLIFNVTMSCLGFLSCCIAKLCFKNPYDIKRKLLMVSVVGSQAFLLGVPVMARYFTCFLDDTCTLSSLTHLHFIFIFLVLDALTFSTHWPENKKPGHYDIFGHGHQIFHVCTTVTMIVELEGMRIDITSGATAHTRPDLYSFIYAYAALIGIELVTLICMKDLLNKKVKEVLSASKEE